MQTSLLEVFEKFRVEQSVDAKAELAGEICWHFNNRYFVSNEKDVVTEIIGILSRDVEVKIRTALASAMKESDDLPHAIARRLAEDIEEVSVPILEFSNVLTEIDLEMIIRSSGEVAKLLAIAKRDELPAKISDCLVNSENENVTKILVGNKTANINERTLNKVVTLFKDSEHVMENLVKRGGMSVGLAERIISVVSDRLKSNLAQKYKSEWTSLEKKVEDSRESVTLSVVAGDSDKSNTLNLVNHLYNNGKLSHSIVLRALCRADLDFFEAGLAKLARISKENAHRLIYNGEGRGFSALFEASSMPSAMLEATEALLKILVENKINDGESYVEYYKLIIKKIIERKYDRTVPNMKYFLALIKSAS